MKQTIKICGCGTPLIYTFAWAYNEYFCINCGDKTEFFNGAECVELTPELRAKKKVIEDIWKAIYKSFLPRSRYSRRNCKKCKNDESHNSHLTEREKLKDKYATLALEKLQGLFN